MTEASITSIDRIRKEAQDAARANESPTAACRYPFGSAGARLWMIEYAKETNRLQRAGKGKLLPDDSEAAA